MNNASFSIDEWLTRHPQAEVEGIINTTITDMKTTYHVKKIGGAGYWYLPVPLDPDCVANSDSFGGKYVVRYLAAGAGLDAGFIAHPSFTLPEEYQSIKNPLSIAWGGMFSSIHKFSSATNWHATELDTANPPEQRTLAEGIITGIDANYQTSLYADAEHGWTTRTNLTDPRKRFAQEGAFLQVVRWFDNYVKK